MKTRRRSTTIFATLLFLAVSAITILAQDNPAPDNPAGPPSPDTVQSEPSGPPPENPPEQPGRQGTEIPGRVARIQYMSGEVSMQPGGVNDWVAATQNRPLTTADRVWTDKNSKAELNVGDGFIRMNSETSVTLSNVSDNTVQIELDQGTLEVTVRHLEGGEIYEIDTPNAAFTVMKPGVYRFDVFPNDDESWITVRKGYGEATGKGNAVRINAGDQVRFRNSNSLEHTAEGAPARDGFDDWAGVRDNRLENSQSARYVSPGVIGAQDLDQYGTWRDVPTYGAIWVPNSVPVGWAPYRYGHWVWIDPWGWTWVDDAPWGFAPSHYGRWVNYDGYWGWSPGPLGYWRPYYAPALVGWIGGPGFGVGVGWGGGWGFGVGVGFGWFPLGWGEPFFPWYGGWGWRGGWYYAGWRGGYWNHYCSPAYFRNVNITNTHITNITNITNNYYRNNFPATHFANQHVNGAVTAAPKSAFTSGAAINRAGMAVSQSQLKNAQMVRTAQVSPTRESMLGGHTPLTHGTPPASAINRSVVTRAPPPGRMSGAGETQAAAPSTNRGPAGNIARGSGTSPNSTAGNFGANNAAHNVPRPPSAGGTQANTQANTGAQGHNNVRYPQNTQEARATAPGNPAVHNVPRPPAANDSFARGGNPGTANHATAGNTPPQATAANGGHYVPRPPSSYTSQPNRSNGEATPPTSRPANHQSAPSTPAQHQSSPSQRESSPSHGSQSKSDHSSGNVARSSAPRPATGNSYPAMPAHTASSAYGANRSYGASSYRRNGMAYPGGSSGYARSGGYSAGSSRGSYPSGPSYGGGGGYSSGPSVASRSYSAPHVSYGGGGGGHYSGGGGGHSSGGGGGHSGSHGH